MSSGSEFARRFAPEAADALDGFEAAAWGEAVRADRVDLVERVAVVCAEQHGLSPLAPPPLALAGLTDQGSGSEAGGAAGAAGADEAVLDFARQFSVDVASITPAQRAAFSESLGKQAATMTPVIFVMDFVPRTRAAFDALAGQSDGPGGSGGAQPIAEPSTVPIWEALVTLARVVPRLEGLDPVTAEVVRLRGARQHQCRLCKSLRSRPALLAGGDESVFAGVDDYEHSDLTPAQKAALAFTDAMIWTPARITGSVPGLLEWFSPAQAVELVFDITRNALNKIAVALEADAAHVDEGIEIYDLDAEGNPLYGLTLA
jgi:alkylhydroperoxidase family enzyme